MPNTKSSSDIFNSSKLISRYIFQWKNMTSQNSIVDILIPITTSKNWNESEIGILISQN